MNYIIHKDPHVIESCGLALKALNDDCRSLKLATIVSDDGFEAASLTPGMGNSGRLASMTSSLQALCDAVTSEMKLKPCEHIMIAAGDGHVVQLRIPDQPLVLCALFDSGETIGRALFAAKNSAATLGRTLRKKAA